MADRILVAGGAGFLGSHVVDGLLKDGRQVWVIDDLSATFGSRCYVNEGAQLIEENVSKITSSTFSSIEEPFDIVINLVAMPFIPDGAHDPESCALTNVVGTATLLHFVRTRWFVQWSSSEVYGTARSPKMSESHLLRPHSFYATTKLIQEILVKEHCDRKGVVWTVLRPFNTFGPRETHPYVVPEIIRQAVSGVVELGCQTARRDFLYVEDLVRAVLAAASRGPGVFGGRTLNIATGEDHAVYEIVKEVGRILGRELETAESVGRMRQNDVDRLTGDASEFSGLTGWKPEVGFEYGLRKTVEWFMEKGKWVYEDGS